MPENDPHPHADPPGRARAPARRPAREPAGVPARVWWYNAALLAVCAGLALSISIDRPPIAHPHVPWWVLAVSFALAERCVVHLHFRRSSHSFSLGELPLVFGLIFARPSHLLLALAVSTVPVLAFERRLPAVKTVFNLAQLTLTTCLAIAVFRLISPDPGPVDATVWIAAFAAIQAAGVVTVALIAGAISLSDGVLPLRMIGRMLAMDSVVATTNTSTALAGAVVTATDPAGIVLLLVPMATVFYAYRAYQAEHQRQESLEFLYETTRALSRSPEVAGALEGLLARSLEAFRAAAAEIVLFGGEGEAPLRTAIGPGDARTVMEPAPASLAHDLRAVVSPEHPVTIVKPDDAPPALARHLAAAGVRSAMVAILPGEHRVLGVLIVADREGVVRDFGPDDLKVFEALANNASVALQYDRLESAVGDLRDIQEQLQHQAFHDSLTGLPNRALFLERVEAALADQPRARAVLFVDVDDFKTVNDTLGHDAGDALLVAVAGRLQACVRPGDTVARFGGDEFALLVGEAGHEAQGAVAVGERIIAAFGAPVTINGRSIPVHTSVGIATGRPGTTAAELLRDADLAMYTAKQQGKGRFRLFEPTMREAVIRRRGLREELERAIARQEFTLRYQPIVELATSEVVGAEALVRWKHPVRGLVAPADFIPLAEETGLIVAVGQLVLDEACHQARSWEERNPGTPPMSIHVNLSAVELGHSELRAGVEGALERSGLEAGRLVLEVTEHLLVHDGGASVGTLESLRDLGVRLALDGFGAGYTSLGHLRTMPLDLLKLAKPLVESIVRTEQEAAFARMVIELAGSLGLDVIAEGIETADQLAILRGFACRHGQGFHIARPFEDMGERPLPLTAAGAWLG
jgi:diguanylate cyclase (GGDEF)-like protein